MRDDAVEGPPRDRRVEVALERLDVGDPVEPRVGGRELRRPRRDVHRDRGPRQARAREGRDAAARAQLEHLVAGRPRERHHELLRVHRQRRVDDVRRHPAPGARVRMVAQEQEARHRADEHRPQRLLRALVVRAQHLEPVEQRHRLFTEPLAHDRGAHRVAHREQGAQHAAGIVHPVVRRDVRALRLRAVAAEQFGERVAARVQERAQRLQLGVARAQHARRGGGRVGLGGADGRRHRYLATRGAPDERGIGPARRDRGAVAKHERAFGAPPDPAPDSRVALRRVARERRARPTICPRVVGRAQQSRARRWRCARAQGVGRRAAPRGATRAGLGARARYVSAPCGNSSPSSGRRGSC